MKRNSEINFCEGPIIPKMLSFALPLLFTMIMQSLFSTADLIVVGKYGEPGALASVGATTEITNLFLNLFTGLSSGVSVCVANRYGAGNADRLSKATHTAILLSVIGGIVVGILGIVLARPALMMMGTPEDVLDGAVLYMSIYFAGMPCFMFINYASAALRAVGDATRSSVYMLIAGAVNVVLNLVFVICLGWNIAGVAIATVISNALCVVLLVLYMLRYNGGVRLVPSKLAIDRDEAAFILRNGIPAGLLGMCFSLSNVITKSYVNALGVSALGGNTAATNLQSYTYLLINSVAQTASVFVGQNYGARNMKRIRRASKLSFFMVLAVGGTAGALIGLLSGRLLSFYTNSADEISFGQVSVWVVVAPYVLYGFIDLFSGILRGMCRPMISTVVSVVGICGVRLLWVYMIFVSLYPHILEKGFAETLSVEQGMKAFGLLMTCYPVSWIVTDVMLVIFLLNSFNQTERRFAEGLD